MSDMDKYDNHEAVVSETDKEKQSSEELLTMGTVDDDVEENNGENDQNEIPTSKDSDVQVNKKVKKTRKITKFGILALLFIVLLFIITLFMPHFTTLFGLHTNQDKTTKVELKKEEEKKKKEEAIGTKTNAVQVTTISGISSDLQKNIDNLKSLVQASPYIDSEDKDVYNAKIGNIKTNDDYEKLKKSIEDFIDNKKNGTNKNKDNFNNGGSNNVGNGNGTATGGNNINGNDTYNDRTYGNNNYRGNNGTNGNSRNNGNNGNGNFNDNGFNDNEYGNGNFNDNVGGDSNNSDGNGDDGDNGDSSFNKSELAKRYGKYFYYDDNGNKVYGIRKSPISSFEGLKPTDVDSQKKLKEKLKYNEKKVQDSSDKNISKVIKKNKNTLYQTLNAVPKFTLRAGSYIPIATLSDINTDNPSPFIGIVRENVFDSVTGRSVVLPIGTRVLGDYKALTNGNETRLYLNVNQLQLPNGKTVNLNQMGVSDLQGMLGTNGILDRRIGQRLGKALLFGSLDIAGRLASKVNIGVQGISFGSGQNATELFRFKERKNVPMPDLKIPNLPTYNPKYNKSDSEIAKEKAAKSTLNGGGIFGGILNTNNFKPTEDKFSSNNTYYGMYENILKSYIEDNISATQVIRQMRDILISVSRSNEAYLYTGIQTPAGNTGLHALTLDVYGILRNGPMSYKESKYFSNMDVSITGEKIVGYDDLKNTVVSNWNSVKNKITINKGTRLNIYVNTDLALEDYIPRDTLIKFLESNKDDVLDLTNVNGNGVGEYDELKSPTNENKVDNTPTSTKVNMNSENK